MIKNSKQKFSEYMQNISRSKSFGKFVLIVISRLKLEKLGKMVGPQTRAENTV